MKVVMLEHLVADKEYKAGDKMTVSDLQAIRMIEKGIAKAETNKAHKELMDRADKVKKEESDKNAKILAIQKGEELKVEAGALLKDLVAIVSIIGSIEPDYKAAFLEEFHKEFTGDQTTGSDSDQNDDNQDKGKGE